MAGCVVVVDGVGGGYSRETREMGRWRQRERGEKRKGFGDERMSELVSESLLVSESERERQEKRCTVPDEYICYCTKLHDLWQSDCGCCPYRLC